MKKNKEVGLTGVHFMKLMKKQPSEGCTDDSPSTRYGLVNKDGMLVCPVPIQCKAHAREALALYGLTDYKLETEVKGLNLDENLDPKRYGKLASMSLEEMIDHLNRPKVAQAIVITSYGTLTIEGTHEAVSKAMAILTFEENEINQSPFSDCVKAGGQESRDTLFQDDLEESRFRHHADQLFIAGHDISSFSEAMKELSEALGDESGDRDEILDFTTPDNEAFAELKNRFGKAQVDAEKSPTPDVIQNADDYRGADMD